MSALTVAVYQVYYTMNYNGQHGYKGQYKRALGSYTLIPRRVNIVEKVNAQAITVGEQPMYTVFGYYPSHCIIDGRFTSDAAYPTPVPQIVNTFNNIFIPGMAIGITDNGGYVNELPNNSNWLVVSYRTARDMSKMGEVDFSLELVKYPYLTTIITH